MSEHKKTDNASVVNIKNISSLPHAGFMVHKGSEEFGFSLPSNLPTFFSLISWLTTSTDGDTHAGEEVLGYNGHYFQVGVLRKDKNCDSVEFDWTVFCEETGVELGGITDFLTLAVLKNTLKIKKP